MGTQQHQTRERKSATIVGLPVRGRSRGELGQPGGSRPNGRRANRLKLILVVGDVVGVLTAWLAAWLVSGTEGLSLTSPLPYAWAIGVLLILRGRDMYLARQVSVRALETATLGRTAVLAATGWYAAATLADVAHLGASATLAAVTFIAQRTIRTAYRHWLNASRRSGRNMRDVIIIGANAEAATLTELLTDHPEEGYRVRGIVGGDSVDLDVLHVQHAELELERFGSLAEAVRALGGDTISGVIVLASALNADEVRTSVDEALAHGLHVQLSHGLRGVAHNRLRPQTLAHESLLYVEPVHGRRLYKLTRRFLIDIPVATVMLAIASPVLLVSALMIKRDGGPVVFAQERVGQNGETFKLLKLRTMVVDADAKLAALMDHSQRQGPLFKMAGDPRITPIGRFLRSSSIDEIPQLVNVLKGEMSLVGPRPALAREVSQFPSELLARLDVPPGLTGLWQVEARDSGSFTAYSRLDLFYVENASLALDIYILASTGWVVMLRLWSALTAARGDAPVLD